jgi:hypothetical protein
VGLQEKLEKPVISNAMSLESWSTKIQDRYFANRSTLEFCNQLEEIERSKESLIRWLLDSIDRNPFYAIRHYLGFYAISLTRGEKDLCGIRVNFYAGEIPGYRAEIHNHSYGFASKILHGVLLQKTFSESLDGTVYERFKFNGKSTIAIGTSRLEKNLGIYMNAGSSYEISHNQIHSTEPVGRDACSLMIRTPYLNTESDKYLHSHPGPYAVEVITGNDYRVLMERIASLVRG